MLYSWLGCAVESPVTSDSVETQAASPLPLVEVLYGGEWSQEARTDGDRVRILLWLRSMELDPGQLRALAEAAHAAQEGLSRLAAAKSQAATDEEEALSEIYQEMTLLLTERALDEQESASFAEELQQSRKGLPDPRALSQRFAEERLAHAEAFLNLLTPLQRKGMANALFFLRQETGASSAPSSFEALLGKTWRSTDFSTLRRSASPAQEGEIISLWTLDAGSTQPLDSLSLSSLLAITALALVHPQLEATVLALLSPEPPAPTP